MKQQEERDEKGSLERGLRIIRLFRPGMTTLGNGDLAELTGLPRSTVSRLTTTMMRAGFLQRDSDAKGYRLGAQVMSLAGSYSTGSKVLQVARPLMAALANDLRIDVNLAVPDGGELIYIESIRQRKEALHRSIQPGHRIPIELTSGGRAWLGGLPRKEFDHLLREYKVRHVHSWPALRREIVRARSETRQYGYCVSKWMAGLVAIGTTVWVSSPERYYLLSIGIGVNHFNESCLHTEYGPAVLRLASHIVEELQRSPSKSR